MGGLPEGKLALAVHRREGGAFEQLVGAYGKPLFNYVQRLVHNASDAQEVVQDAFLRAHKALTRRYSPDRCREMALKAWLFRIARNLAQNKLRSRRRHDREMALEEGHNPVGFDGSQPSVTVLCDLERKQELLRLDRAIASLPRESRELILLRFIEEMSYSEIANTVGGSETALRGKVFRALKKLRDATQLQETTNAV